MSAPKPLTLCPAPALDWSRPDTPASAEFGDIYFSTEGGLDEARLVFLEGCGLPQKWSDTQRFVIGELGFGSGLNFLAAWQKWAATQPQNAQLHFVSIEKYPFTKEQLTSALSTWPELSLYSDALIKVWPGRVRGIHRLHFGNVTLTLIHDDIQSALDALDMKANAWFLDGFSPTKNPDMWSHENMRTLANLSAEGATLASFTVAASVRQALTEAGFLVERKKGFGKKRNRLEARLKGKTPSFSYSDYPTPTIIGTGIGGLSLTKAFMRRGITPIIIQDPNHIQASGNAAALVKPRLDLQDRPESRFFLTSYLYALEAYSRYSIHKGVSHLAKTEKELQRHQKLCEQSPLPKAHLYVGKTGALEFPSALVIDPEHYRLSVTANLEIENTALKALPTKESPLFITAGYGIKTLLPDWPLRFSRGQLTAVKSNDGIPHPISYGGYALPLKGNLLLGATHDRIDKDENPFTLKSADDAQNISMLKQYTNVDGIQSDTPSRASVRVTSPDTLPVLGQTEYRHFVLTGLGSRGFVFAPLLAEAIVSHFYGDPVPIEKAVWQKFSAKRLFKT